MDTENPHMHFDCYQCPTEHEKCILFVFYGLVLRKD